jgi:hypothetical protein
MVEPSAENTLPVEEPTKEFAAFLRKIDGDIKYNRDISGLFTFDELITHLDSLEESRSLH